MPAHLLTRTHRPAHMPQETCGLVQQRWAQAGGSLDPEDPLLTAFVRLLVQLFSTQLRWVQQAGVGV